MRHPKISIIIPTLNEEEHIQSLLYSIKKQSLKEHEIIISDSGSTDKTIKIAKIYGAKITRGAKKGPGAGRNLGARHARGDVLVFFDADVKLKDKNTLSEINKLLETRKDVVGGFVKFYSDDGRFMDNAFYKIAAQINHVLITSGFLPGFSTFVRKSCFLKLGGFNETMQFNEDHDFGQRLKKIGKLRCIRNGITTSSRRLRYAGYLKTIKDYGTTVNYILNIPNSKHIRFEGASSIMKKYENKKVNGGSNGTRRRVHS